MSCATPGQGRPPRRSDADLEHRPTEREGPCSAASLEATPSSSGTPNGDSYVQNRDVIRRARCKLNVGGLRSKMVQFRDGDSEAENQAPALLRLHARRRRAGTPCAERFPQSAGPLSAHRAPYWAQGCPDAHFTDEETGSGTGRDLPGTTISFTSCGVPPRVIIITLGAWLGPAEFGDGLQPAGGVALRCLPLSDPGFLAGRGGDSTRQGKRRG